MIDRKNPFGAAARSGRLMTRASAAAVIAVLASTPAWAAQEAPTAPNGSEAAPAADQGNLQEIIVTAQRRSENLQNVPISVTAVNANTLETTGISSTLALPRIVPSVQMVRSGIASIFFIRGIGNSSGGTGEEGANAFYIDGVYLADLQQANTEFNNIDRVEVLKGPQGTLFGRNASGGLINVITKEPGNDLEVKGKIGYGNYDTYRGQLYVGGPLSSTVSADIALTGRDQRNGYGTNLATGDDTLLGWAWGVRSKLVFKPNSDLKFVLAADYWHNRDSYGSGFTIGPDAVLAAPAGTPLTTPGTRPGPTPGSVVYGYAGDYNTNSLNDEWIDVKARGVSLTASDDLGFATLTNITAYRYMNAISNVDSDYGPPTIVQLTIPSHDKTFQEELRLASDPGGKLTWQVGAFYFWQNVGVDNQKTFGTGVGSGNYVTSAMRTNSYSGFGEATYDITPTTHLTGGLRYTHEVRRLTALQTNLLTGAVIFNAPNPNEIRYNKWTYRAAIRQDITDDINVYASYNRGFKSGLWQLNAPSAAPVKPQTTDAFEVGFKSQLLDRMLRVNVAYYHYNVKDYQVRAAPQTSATPILLNATSAKIDGVEAHIELAPTRNLQIFSDLNYLNARFGSFPGAPFTYPRPATCNPAGSAVPGQSTGAPSGGSTTCLGDASGNRIPLSPKFSMNVGANYTVPLNDSQAIVFNALFSHNSGYYFEQDNRLRQPAFDLLSGSIEFRANEHWGVEVWANNLTNKHYWLDQLGSSTADRGESAAPRTFGVDLKFNY